MHEVLAKSLTIVVALFVFSAMLNLGLELTLRQIIVPLRNPMLIGRALLANVVLVPLVTVAMAMLLPIDAATKIGLVLYGCCIGSEGGAKLAQVSGGDAAFGIALLVLFLALTVIGAPFVIPQFVPDAHIDESTLLLKLLAVVALPLSIGLTVHARNKSVAARMSAVFARASLAFLLLALVLALYVHIDNFMALESITALAALLFFAIAFGVGWVVAGGVRLNQRTLAMMTMMRGGSVAMFISAQAFVNDPGVLTIVSIMTVLSLILGVPVAFLLRRSAP